MRIVERGTVFRSEPDTDHQSCAFAQVAVLPSGRWVCSCRAAPTKGGNEDQHVLLSRSDDQGASWSPPVDPFTPLPAIDGRPGRFRSFGLTPLGGDQVLGVLSWVDYSDPALPFFNEETEGLLDTRIFLTRSSDGGETWGAPELMATSPFNCPTPTTGPVLVMANGDWAVQVELNKHYYDTSPWVHASVLLFSPDEGRTWPRHAVVSRDPENRVFYWDQRPQVLADGLILDVFWTYDTATDVYLNIHARSSSDSGASWTEIWDTGLPGQPGPPVSLPDGRAAMVYVDRTGAPAIRCRVSADGGRSWPDETQLSIYESALPNQIEVKSEMADAWSEMAKYSVGLPATAGLSDGRFLVVYYAGEETDSTNVDWAVVEA